MTDEERIDWLCRLRADLNNGVIFTPWNKEFTEALTELLEQQPCGDAISREDAVNALRKALYKYEDETEKKFKESKELNFEDWFQHRIFVQNMNDIDIQTILELPSVKPQQENGEWIEVWDKDHLVILAYKCSECGSMRNAKTSYCADCGADMRGEADDK